MGFFKLFPEEETCSLPHSQSEPVSLQPQSSKATNSGGLLLQTVVQTVEADSPALMVESTEEIMEEFADDVKLELNADATEEVKTVENEELNSSSMSSSRTTVTSSTALVESSNSITTKLDTTLTEEDTETMMDDAMRPNNMEEKRSEASSSSKSYELLKLESLPNSSGHTSGDDVEVITNNSSDIEVICSPVYSEYGRHQASNQQLLHRLASPSKDHSSRYHRKGEWLSTDSCL